MCLYGHKNMIGSEQLSKLCAYKLTASTAVKPFYNSFFSHIPDLIIPLEFVFTCKISSNVSCPFEFSFH